MSAQIENLRIICELLCLDTSDQGLTDCPLADLYLKRIIHFLGGA